MRGLLGFLIAGLSLLCVVLIVRWESSELVSPGPLHSAHLDNPKLQGAAGCAMCHSAATHDLASSCAQCHEEIDHQIEQRIGLHGTGEEDARRNCGECHIEHVGESIPLAGPHAFRVAGIEDVAAYDHRHVENFGLDGRHLEITCADCHQNADTETLPEGELRFLGLSQDCTSCHEDPHEQEFGTDCASCHGQQQEFAVVARFQHDPRFKLEGAHASVACAACHVGGTSLDAEPPAATRQCADCHANPHATGQDAPETQSLRLSTARDCAECHDTHRFDAPDFTVADHATRAFDLEGPHGSVDCAACHGNATQPAIWQSDAPTPLDCAACHDSPHRAEFVEQAAEIARVSSDLACATCHEFADPAFSNPHAELSAELHAASGFSLELPHTDVACHGCHEPATATPTFADRFPGRSPDACASCHDDPHDGQFDVQGEPRNCTECHSDTQFFPSTFDAAAHADTSFPLDGAHVAVACTACHVEALRVSGARVRRFDGTAGSCANCHDDPHAGRFDQAGMPQTVDSRQGCARCHSTTLFSEVAWTADSHAAWTGFELRGAHVAASCVDCHGSPLQPAPRDCASCHSDVHAGQFVVREQNDCARCHTETATFQELSFDHARDTRFRLDDNHERLECSACHVARPTRSGELIVRYRPLGRECRDCHSTGRDR